MEEVNPNTNLGEVVENRSVAPHISQLASKLAEFNKTRTQEVKPNEDAQTGVDAPVEEIIDNGVNEASEVVELDNESELSTEVAVDDETPEEVSESIESDTDVLDFVDLANQSPDTKFKFIVNGKEVIKTAKQAAALLGQSSAIHEKARELKVERAAFEEESSLSRKRQTDLLVAMDYIVEPRLKEAYNIINQNIVKLNQLGDIEVNYKNDLVATAQINQAKEALVNEINKTKAIVEDIKPQVDSFRALRQKQIKEALTENRNNFTDAELKNKYNFDQLREKIAKNWKCSKDELIPGVPNLDIVSADEQILSLIRDGLRYREKVPSKSSGASVAQILKKTNSNANPNAGKLKPPTDSIEDLRERIKRGDKAASAKMFGLYLKKTNTN